MTGDAPKVGQVVDHYFLWFDEQRAGRVEGRKARPCLIVAVEAAADGTPRVTVLPITSQAPRTGAQALAIPDDVRPHIGLDPKRPAWVVLDDANVFAWPGFDLVPRPGGGFVRGVVTRGFFTRVRDAVSVLRVRGRPRPIERDD